MIKLLPDQLINQIAAGEVVERPASVAKELVENALDAGARRVQVDIELGGRRLLRVTDDGSGMTRDDAVMAFERHATSKIRSLEDLVAIGTLGFRGEALASIASVAKVELITKNESDAAATRVVIEGSKLIDVKDAARPRGTTISVRDLFFNTPARRKFLRSEATENFHLINLVTHYALAHPDIAFTVTNNGRETLQVTPAKDLRERAFQLFGGDFLNNLLPVDGGREYVAKIGGYISAPRERRTTRDAQYFFINGRFVRDKVLARGLSEGYRSVLPHGAYPVALLFLEVPKEEVDVNVHPAKTEVRFRRIEAVRETVTEAVRQALARAGILEEDRKQETDNGRSEASSSEQKPAESDSRQLTEPFPISPVLGEEQQKMDFIPAFSEDFERRANQLTSENATHGESSDPVLKQNAAAVEVPPEEASAKPSIQTVSQVDQIAAFIENNRSSAVLPPLDSADKLVKTVETDQVSRGSIQPLGQLDESYIIAIDDDGLLLVDQHVAHERILFDKYSKLLKEKKVESQNLLLPETFDLTPAQAAAFDEVQEELDVCGFGLMRLSGRTVAIKSVPMDLPAHEARNLLAEILETVDREKHGAARTSFRDDVAASLACRAAIKVHMKLTMEKMHWLIDRLLVTSSPTTCPHGRPVILRLTMRDIEKGFHRI
ncbi:MAG TPA: DNA mismatch repair endonuclease MutL [Pyrinomonadaceae bacterium]|nr:DNA mismatch repair endonuclease MutL [Pyrinomonadaceae bacterium]